MTKRYREPIEVVELDGAGAGVLAAPRAFRWRGQRYRVTAVLGHWREDAGWWRQGGVGAPQRIEQTDLWRVEAANGHPGRGVYELVCRAGEWRLDRIWD